MLKTRIGTFETNSSSTHALILTNEQFNETLTDGDLLSLVNFSEMEADISIFTGEPDDRTYEGKEYSTYEGCFTNIIDKIRYLYTCLCQDGLYETVDGKVVLNIYSPAYYLFEDLKLYLTKLKFIPPKESCVYVFEDCEWITRELCSKSDLLSTKNLGLFLLKGKVVYCSRDEDPVLNDELHDIVKQNNRHSILVSG